MKAGYWLNFGCRLAAGVALAGGLAGCADPGRFWHRPGVSDAQRDRDYAACRAQTSDASERGEAADIEASENGQSHQPGVLPETSFNRGAGLESGNALGQCMFDQGYRYE